MEENFSMEWKIFSMKWKWNGRKLPVWNMEKSSSIPCPASHFLLFQGAIIKSISFSPLRFVFFYFEVICLHLWIITL